MISEIQSIAEDKKVKSRELRDLADKTYNRIAKAFHRTMKASGSVRTAAVCMEMLSSSLNNIIFELTDISDNKRVITPYTVPTYPDSKYHRAERTPGLMCINAKRISTRPVFTDTNGVFDTDLVLSRTISTSDSLPVKEVIENSLDHMFKDGSPYVCRITKDEIVRTSVSVTVSSPDTVLPINAIRYVPMPAAGIGTLNSIYINGSSPLIMNGGYTFPDVSVHTMDRTYQGYLHFEPQDLSRLTFTMSSEVYISSLDCIAMGISRIIGEYNTYALKSYIGWEVPYKDGYTKLKKLTPYPAQYSGPLENVSFRLYSNITDYSLVNSNYISIFSGTQEFTNINSTQYPNLYLLMELSSVNNTTPCVGKIELEFE